MSGPAVVEPSRVIVGPQTLFSLAGADPVSNGVSAGTAAVAMLINETLESCGLSLDAPPDVNPGAPPGSCANPVYSAPFAMPAGTSTLGYFALDNVFNADVLNSTVTVGDHTPPAVALAGLPAFTNNPTPSFRAVFTDTLAGVNAASLSLSVPGSTLTTSVVSDATFTWRSGTPLPAPMYTHTMLYWNENLYIVGGIDNTALRAQVHRTPLTDGAPLSAWQTTEGLTTPSGVMGAAAAADHLFVMGSFAPGSIAVWQTQVNSDGTLAGWNRGKDLPVQLSSLQGVAVGAAGGYLYAIGGQSSDNAPRDQVYVNKLTPQGTLGDSWTGVTSLKEPMTDSAAAAYGGRIYTLSGRGVGGAASRFVRSAEVMADGALGVDGWRVETDLPAGRYWGRALAAGGRLYFLGGRDDSSPRSEVWSAPIGDDGWLGAWKEEPPLHAPLMLLGAAASPDVLFYSGGANNAGVSAELRYGRLVPEGGFLATATVTAVPAAPLQDDTYTLLASGSDRVLNAGSGSISFTVDTQPPTLSVSANGLPLVDGETRTLNAAVLEFVAASSDTSSGVNPSSFSLRLDGADVGVAGSSEIRFSPAALTPGEHHLEARVSDRAGNAAVVSARFLYDPAPPAVAFLAPADGAVYGAGPVEFHAVLEDALSGMATGSVVLTVDGATVAASVSATGSGEALAWHDGTDLPEPMYTHTMLYWNGYLYIVGGIDSTAFRSQVHRSSLTDGEPLSGWSPTTGLATHSGVMGAAAAAGRLFVMGSFSPGSLSVWQSVVGAQGALGTWEAGPNLPMPLSSLQGVAVGASGGYLYAIGGQSGDNVARAEVYVNTLGSDGALGPGWDEVTPLKEHMTDSAAAAYGGRIYTVSGRGLNGAASRFARSAPVLSDGKLGVWRDETDLPQGRYWGRALAAGGRLYFLGGRDDSSPRNEVWSAPIGNDGFLGAWVEEAPLHAPLMLFGAAASPDVLFYSGGVNNSGVSAELRFGRVPGSNASVTATGTVAGLGEGPRVFQASGSDLAGNAASASVTVHIDLSPPLTSLVVQGASSTAPGLVLAQAGATVTLRADDQPASGNAGVAATYVAINDGPFSPAPATLALSTGTSLLQFWSLDALGHRESTQTVLVTLQDAESVAVAVDGNAGIAAAQEVTIATVSVADAPSVYELARDSQGLVSVFPVYYELTGGIFPTGEPALLSFYIDLNVVPDTTTLRIFTFDDSRGIWVSSPILNQQFTLLSDNYGVFTGELLHTSAYALMRRTLLTDTQPPAVAFAFPRPDEPGLCRLAQGPVTVRGSVTDEELASWSVVQGSVLVGSGTVNADGTLGTWDAAGLSGAFGLTLSALDASGNTASAALDVQAGEPARVLALGGKQVLNKPRGVAAGPDRVYVADTNADRVRVFDAAGVALAALGDKKGAAKLNKPAGLALDVTGNIWVADANNKRVVKLSPAGVWLAEYGKGVLKRPVAVALSQGRVVVADAKAGQLVVFSDSGALLARVELPPTPSGPDEDPEEPRPVALAADAAGNVWAADAKGGRVLRFAPELTLAQTIPGFERPEGVAISPSGACLAVSDGKAARIRTFDAAWSAGLAAFGVHGEIKENKPLPPEFLLNKPAQLAFTPSGTLLVADRNNDLIQGFGLPSAPLVLAMGAPGRPGGGTRLTAAEGGADEAAATARVGRFEGGRVEHPDGAAVEVPAGALAADVDVAVAKAADSGDEHRAREAARGLAGLGSASAAREFSPHGLAFAQEARITLPYDPLLAGAPSELKVHYWNAERGVWEALASEVDTQARTVSARVAHFSVYQVLGPAGAFNTLADPEAGFAFRAIYAFPNPAVGGQKPTVHVAVGRADKVTVRFYDVAGTPVHEATLDTPSVVNDESGPHWAYEYAWNGHIPSGVYLYSVTAEKAGHAPIKRIGKLAVVR